MTCLGLTSFILSQILVSEILSRPHKRLMELYDSDGRLLDILETQIRHQESHVQLLERLGKYNGNKEFGRLERISACASRYVDKEQYMSNALNNLVLLRRLTTDWPALSRTVPKLSSVVSEVPWPEEEDVRSVVRALTRLQLTYDLRTEDLANGLVNNNPAHVNLTGEDCLNVALYYHEDHRHLLASQWLEQALSKHDNKISTDTILESTAISKCFLGDSDGSAKALTKLLNDFPDYKSSITNFNSLQALTFEGCSTLRETLTATQDQLSNERMDKFNLLCRAATGSTLQPQHVLSCRYVHYNKTRLRLGPFRAEELQLDPPVLMFHDVISDDEIKEVQRLSGQNLRTSMVISDEGRSYVSPHRSSETMWLKPGSDVVDRLNLRMADMTNLNMHSSEFAQISRYGLGGEYLPHTDALDTHIGTGGDRIATLMIYLSEVPDGGHTVFQKWGLSVRPQKGAALFWFNLHRNGTEDESTEHAGCPVIRGTKWVLNKWFHELNNDFATYCVDDQAASFQYFYI